MLTYIKFLCLFTLVASENIGRLLEKHNIGEFTVNIEDFPYQVSVFYHQSFLCSGAIVHSKAILTTATCISGTPNSGLYIRAGSSLLNEGGYTVSVKSVRKHPNFNVHTSDYDISVMILAESLPFGDEIKPVELADASSNIPLNTYATISGWVSGNKEISISNVLKATKSEITSLDDCKSVYGQNLISNRMICLQTSHGGDPCIGNDGGPLVSTSNQLLGVASFGYDCGISRNPRICSSVPALRPFIDEILASI